MGEESDQPRGVYCLVATYLPQAKDARSTPPYESGVTVYCFPPNLAGAYESVKVIGPAIRGGKLTESLVAAHDLTGWRAEAVRDRDVIRAISPPWDATEVSKNVAKGVAAWKAGGAWPAAEVREWNRANAQKQVGPDTLLGRVKGLLGKALGRE